MSDVPSDLATLLSGPHAPQRAFAYPRDRWLAWTGHLDGIGAVLHDLPDRLDRRITAEVVDQLVPDNVAAAFTVAMIWGHGQSGYGPYRTARVLTDAARPVSAALSADVVRRLGESAQVAREHGAVAGYRYLNIRPGKVAGLGPAFFTKWLYFATAEGSTTTPTAAPVLDKLVISWLSSRGVHLRAGYTDDYARYIEMLTRWGDPHRLSPSQVEERIFRLIRDDGAAAPN